jgi:hypothetical protein
VAPGGDVAYCGTSTQSTGLMRSRLLGASYVLAGHGVQLLWPTALAYVPALHCVHDAAEAKPLLHMHCARLVLLGPSVSALASQLTHASAAVLPVTLRYVLLGHGKHASAPLSGW